MERQGQLLNVRIHSITTCPRREGNARCLLVCFIHFHGDRQYPPPILRDVYIKGMEGLEQNAYSQSPRDGTLTTVLVAKLAISICVYWSPYSLLGCSTVSADAYRHSIPDSKGTDQANDAMKLAACCAYFGTSCEWTLVSSPLAQ